MGTEQWNSGCTRKDHEVAMKKILIKLSTLIEIDTEYRVKHKKRVWESKPVIFKIERNDKN